MILIWSDNFSIQMTTMTSPSTSAILTKARFPCHGQIPSIAAATSQTRSINVQRSSQTRSVNAQRTSLTESVSAPPTSKTESVSAPPTSKIESVSAPLKSSLIASAVTRSGTRCKSSQRFQRRRRRRRFQLVSAENERTVFFGFSMFNDKPESKYLLEWKIIVKKGLNKNHYETYFIKSLGSR